MKVLVDATCLREPITGIGKYATHAVSEMGRLRPDWQWVVVSDPGTAERAMALVAGAERVIADPPIPNAFPARQRVLGELVSEVRPDVFFNPASAAPDPAFPGSIVTIHDLGLIARPRDTGDTGFLGYHFAELRHAARNAARIVAVSAATKRELMRCFNVLEQRVAVVHLAAEDRFRTVPPEEVSAVLHRYGIEPGYVLGLHMGSPRKNARGLFAAYAMLPEGLKQRHPLLVVGDWSPRHVNLWQLGYEERILEHLVLTGVVPGTDLPALYAGAAVFAYPSWIEGFGIPLLEAMAAGTPVVTSNVSAMPEVAADAALQADPTDPRTISACVKRVLTQAPVRERLSRLGRQRTARFTWTRTAEALIGELEQQGGRLRA